MKSAFFNIIVFVFAISISSCSSGDKNDDVTEISDTTKKAVEETRLDAQNVFNSLPDRESILKLIEENKLEYDAEILNNPENLKKYTTELYMALNLGCYGSDLSVAGVFQQTQESILYLKCVNHLAEKLGVNQAFNQTMFDKLEAYKDNKDSTLEIITLAFKQADIILKGNNRPATSALIIAGVWIEGFNTSCKIAKKTPSEGVIKAILEQKSTLYSIITMLNDSKLSPEASFVINDLNVIYGIITELNNSADKKFSYDFISKADEAISRLRNKVCSAT